MYISLTFQANEDQENGFSEWCGNDYVGPVQAQFANCTKQAEQGNCQDPLISHLCPETCLKTTGCHIDFSLDCLDFQFQLLCHDSDEDIKNLLKKLCPETCVKTPTASCENYDDNYCPADSKIFCDDANFDKKFFQRWMCLQLCGVCSS